MPPSLLLAATPAETAWEIALPGIVGLLAVYLLLPRPRGYPLWLGVTAAALALLLAGVVLTGGGGANVETVLFYAFSAIAVVSGALLVTQRNPVRGALSFALVVLSTCGLFLLQAAPFLMAATIIIYAGAIIVTFLFVIMLAQQLGISDADQRSREPFLSCVAGFVLLGALLYVLQRDLVERSSNPLTTIFPVSSFDGLLERTKSAAQKSTVADMKEAFDDGLDLYETAALAARGTEAGNELLRKVRTVKAVWPDLKLGGQVAAMRHELEQLEKLGRQVRKDWDDKGQARLPAANVAGLGQLLFTSYLLPVELGGTLLLVATIGAIAITGRRAEGQR
jgi:NADH:ubiquinone oxidoreductase subunit 6 (subunit J)